jgi:hypothetical protein
VSADASWLFQEWILLQAVSSAELLMTYLQGLLACLCRALYSRQTYNSPHQHYSQLHRL